MSICFMNLKLIYIISPESYNIPPIFRFKLVMIWDIENEKVAEKNEKEWLKRDI